VRVPPADSHQLTLHAVEQRACNAGPLGLDDNLLQNLRMLPRVLYRNPSTLAYNRARVSYALRASIPSIPRYYSVVTKSSLQKKSKVWDSVDEAVKDVKSGDIVLSGGACFDR
jgi:hypothetical protein